MKSIAITSACVALISVVALSGCVGGAPAERLHGARLGVVHAALEEQGSADQLFGEPTQLTEESVTTEPGSAGSQGESAEAPENRASSEQAGSTPNQAEAPAEEQGAESETVIMEGQGSVMELQQVGAQVEPARRGNQK